MCNMVDDEDHRLNYCTKYRDCPRSLIFASPVVRVIQNENRRSEKIVFNVKDEFCKQTKTNESLPKQTKANKTNL